MAKTKRVGSEAGSEAARPRFTRQRWLESSLEVLDRRGTPGLILEEITRELGVSTGSFYWHFASHGEYLRALAEYWAEVTTQAVVDRLAAVEGTPRERLRMLMQEIVQRHARRLDLQFRSLAISYPEVRRIVERVDKTRFKLVESLFADLGFRGNDLKVRTHCFVVVHSLEEGVHAGLSEKEILTLLDERIRFFLGE